MERYEMKVRSERPKVYGVYGLTEWHALLPLGRRKVRVSFTGGALSGYGVVPATFATAHPVLQHVIEHSEHFRSGKIVLMGGGR